MGLTSMNDHESKPRQRFLALDTSTASLAVAVMQQECLLREINASGERNHSVHMHPVIARAIEEAGLGIRDLDGIAVGVGPGSYTGVRMAVTAAKTFSWANKIPLVGVSSLHALAWGGLEDGLRHEDRTPEQSRKSGPQQKREIHWVIPLLDARRGQVYTALFARKDSKDEAPVRLEPDAIRLMESWVDALGERLHHMEPDERPSAIWFTGDVAVHAKAAERLAEAYNGRLTIRPYELEGRWVGRLGAGRLLRGESDEAHALVPNYTQLSEAEANLLRKR